MLKKMPQRTKVLLLIAVVLAVAAAGLGIWGYKTGKISTQAQFLPPDWGERSSDPTNTITGQVATQPICPYGKMSVQVYAKSGSLNIVVGRSGVNQDGNFNVSGLDWGTYQVILSSSCSNEQLGVCGGEESPTVTFTGVGQTQSVSLKAIPFKGKVTVAVNIKCVPQPGGRCPSQYVAVDGAKVYYTDAEGASGGGGKTQNGHIVFGLKPVGQFTIRVEKEGYSGCEQGTTHQVSGCTDNKFICTLVK